MAPLAIVSPLAGVFVDRWPLKRTMIASDLIRGVLVLALVFVHDVYAIYAILFTMSVVSAFFVPAQSVSVRTLAPPGGLMAVNALMTQAMQAVTPPASAWEYWRLAMWQRRFRVHRCGSPRWGSTWRPSRQLGLAVKEAVSERQRSLLQPLTGTGRNATAWGRGV
jgi:MFS family permease